MILGRDVVVLHLTALVYILFDLLLFHLLSAWLTMLVEAIEFAPIVVGAWLYGRTRRLRWDRRGRIPRLLYVPVVSTVVQVQILIIVAIYRHVAFT